MSRGQTKRNRVAKLIITFIVFLVVGILSVQIIMLYQKNREYQAIETALNEQKAREEARAEQLAQYELYMQTQEYIEDTAQSKLGLVYDDEIIFKER